MTLSDDDVDAIEVKAIHRDADLWADDLLALCAEVRRLRTESVPRSALGKRWAQIHLRAKG